MEILLYMHGHTYIKLLKGYDVWGSYKLHTTNSTTNILLRDLESRLYHPAFSFQNTIKFHSTRENGTSFKPIKKNTAFPGPNFFTKHTNSEERWVRMSFVRRISSKSGNKYKKLRTEFRWHLWGQHGCQCVDFYGYWWRFIWKVLIYIISWE